MGEWNDKKNLILPPKRQERKGLKEYKTGGINRKQKPQSRYTLILQEVYEM